MRVFRSVSTARVTLPRLTVAQRVVDKMVRNALVYETETGEALVGFAMRNLRRFEPDLYVIETIPPDDSAIRRGAYFEQGDYLQGDIFAWWFDNWNLYRKRRQESYGNATSAKWDVPLKHLGDWHKHPGTLTEPSWGDADTAFQRITDHEVNTPYILAILATVWSRALLDAEVPDEPAAASADAPGSAPTEAQAAPDKQAQPAKRPGPLKVPIDDQTVVRLDPWYMSRRTRRFVRLAANVVADKALPALPIIGWHLSQPERLQREIEALKAGGYSVSLEQYDADQAPPLEICLALAKRAGQNVFIVVTEADYPHKRPSIRLTPMAVMKEVQEGEDLFLKLWGQSQPLAEEAYPEWTPDRTILDLVRAVEEGVSFE